MEYTKQEQEVVDAMNAAVNAARVETFVRSLETARLHGYMGAKRNTQTAVNTAATVLRGYCKTGDERTALEAARKQVVARIAA